MHNMSKKTERLRPEVTLGGTVESLSVPQQDETSDPNAVQKHHEAPIATHPNIFPMVLYETATNAGC